MSDATDLFAKAGLDDFLPLTPANPAAPKPKCKRHDWRVGAWADPQDGGKPVWDDLTAQITCYRCSSERDPVKAKRGNRNRQRGNSIERELGKKLGMARTGQYGGKDDLANALFAAQVKSGGYFSNRQWDWLKAVPVKAGQTALLVIADTPGPGKKRRAMVILDLDDWRELHGTVEA